MGDVSRGRREEDRKPEERVAAKIGALALRQDCQGKSPGEKARPQRKEQQPNALLPQQRRQGPDGNPLRKPSAGESHPGLRRGKGVMEAHQGSSSLPEAVHPKVQGCEIRS